MRVYENINDIDLPSFSDGRLYIYVVENAPQGNIKIGRSSNVKQRMQSLSGSNSGGNHLIRFAVSDETWLYTLERIAHQKFAQYRIDGTEWFDGNYVSFEDAVNYIDSLFCEKDYQHCNEVRKNFMTSNRNFVCSGLLET